MIKIIFSIILFFSVIFNITMASEIYHKNKLEIHFLNLKNSTKLDEARNIEKNIWSLWNLHPKNEFLTNKLELGTELMENGQHKYAYKIFSNIIFDDPNWSEAWNKRATTYYLLGNFNSSIADIVETLKLEPRHFGALSGLAMIQNYMGNKKAAIEALSQAINIHPFMSLNSSLKEIKKDIGEEI